MILLKTTQERLLEVLQSVSGIVEKRHTLPVLANVLLDRLGDLSFTEKELIPAVVLHAPAFSFFVFTTLRVTVFEMRTCFRGSSRRRRRSGANCWRLIRDGGTRRRQFT
jgi:hypothetical protein